MEIYRFDREVGRSIKAFDSRNLVMTKLLREAGDFHIGCMHLSEKGLVGYHQAQVNQLFIVVQGNGWVRDEHSDLIPVEAGQAIFWKKGKWHETSTEEGLMAIVIEGEAVKPDEMMEKIGDDDY